MKNELDARNRHICFVAASLAAVFLIGLILSTLKYRSLQVSCDQLKQENEHKKQALLEKEQDIEILIQDKAKIVRESRRPYSFEKFGIYSPYFPGKEVRSIVYSYKRNTIKQMILELPQEGTEDISIQIEVWEFADTRQLDSESKDLIIFDNWRNPVSLSKLKERWEDPYINLNSIYMYRAFDLVAPLNITYYLEFMQTNSPMSHPILVRFSVVSELLPNKAVLVGKKPEELISQEKVRQLEMFADSVDIRRTGGASSPDPTPR